MKKSINISEFINTKYKDYALYTLNNRAIPSLRDGFKPVQRRILYIAKNEAKDFIKVSNLSGRTLCIHPHGDAAISGTIGNMTQDFCGSNNIPYFTGKGAFGDKISGPGNGIGAPRYVSIKLSRFTEYAIFKDYELVNIIPNYDGEYQEVENFLPIIPIVLLNGISGIAVGFATEILPYNIEDIIDLQIKYLEAKNNKNTPHPYPYYRGFGGKISFDTTSNRFKSEGNLKIEKDFIRIVELPIGITRETFIKLLDTLIEKDEIKDYKDYSKGDYDIRIYPKKLKELKEREESYWYFLFKLSSFLYENLTIIDTNNNLKVFKNIYQIIDEFTSWRFSFYKKRYEKLYSELDNKLNYQKELLNFISFVIQNNYLEKMTKMNKNQIRDTLIGKFPSIEKFLNLSISIFNLDNMEILKREIPANEKILEEYKNIKDSETKQKKIYINELNELKKEKF